jgi:hypothetical protein
MNKIFIILGVMALLLVGSVSGYMCIHEEDNQAVQQFKYNMNIAGLQNDIDANSLTEEAFYLKLKYFNPCN